MTKIYNFLIVFIILSLGSCIEPYDVSDVDIKHSIVVDGLITDEQEDQTVRLLRATSIAIPNFDPILGAVVTVFDIDNNVFEFREVYETKGTYTGRIPAEYLVPGNAFKLHFETVDGSVYESDFEEMSACPEVDSVFYEIDTEYYEGSNNYSEEGIKYFVDLRKSENYSNYYRWKLIETYEYRATFPIQRYWYGRWRYKPSPDYSLYYCYMTEPVGSIFTGTTTQLTDNGFLRSPLHFVNNQTQKLYFRYSLLIKQMSISENAYIFWEGLKSNNQTSGGLFDKQPGKVQGNVECLTNPGEPVLGYFGVSSVSSKRVFVYNNELEGKINFFDDVFCTASAVEDVDWIMRSHRPTWPIYFAPSPTGDTSELYHATKSCFDCTLKGGTVDLPDFWKDK